MINRRASLTVMGVIAAGSLVLSACGGGDATATPRAAPTATRAPSATATPAPASTQAPPTAAPARVKRGGTIRQSTNVNLAGLDPSKTENYTITFPLQNVWSNIVQYGWKTWTDMTIVSDLAQKWEVSDGGKKFTFRLNPDARWQNIAPLNGRALTAEDAKWSLDLYLDAKYASAIGGRIRSVASVEAPDKATLVVNLKEPASNFLNNMAWATVKVMPREVYERDGSFEKTVVGSGAFVYDKWEPGSRLTMKASTNFWINGADGKALPYVDSLEVLIIADPQTNLSALKTGLVDIPLLSGVSRLQVPELKGVKSIVIEPSVNPVSTAIGFNHTVKPFNDVRVRRALLKGLDMGSIMRNILEAPTAPLESFVYASAEDLSYPQAKLKELQTRDVEGAKKLLAEAGIASGFKIELMVALPEPDNVLIIQAVQQQWSQLGLDVTLAPTGDRLALLARRTKGDFTTILNNLNLQGEPISMLDFQWRTGAPNNFTKYSNPAVDRLIDEAKLEFDRAKMRDKLQEAQRIMWEDVAGVPVSTGPTNILGRDYVKDWHMQWGWGNQGLEYAWLDK